MIDFTSMKALSGTLTEKNLAMSFAGECMARTKYAYFAEVAKKQGFEHISSIFAETAENEREHAKIFLNLLKQNNGGSIEVPASVPLTGIGSTKANLQAAANGENAEHTKAYPKFAEIAKNEGFTGIAKVFQMIADVEKQHEIRFRKLLEQVENGTVFKRNQRMTWKCRNCGFIMEGYAAPKVCPACNVAQSFFEVTDLLE